MTTVTIYRFTVWNAGETILTHRMATREAILKLYKGEVLEDTATEIDRERLDGNDTIRLDSRGLLYS